MIFHEFGCENEKILLMFHGSCMTWDMYEEAIGVMAEKIHVIIPAITGHDVSIKEDFTSVEEVVSKTEDWLIKRGYQQIEGIYGLSMGGGMAIRLLANQRILVKYAVIDGGITPYQLPLVITRLIVVRDFLMIGAGKNSKRLLSRVFNPEKYQQEIIDGVYQVLRHYNARSIWRVFESSNNYSMPDPVPQLNTQIEYWYGEYERKDRNWDIKYVKKIWPKTTFKNIPDVSHGEYSVRFQKDFAKYMLVGMCQPTM